jgi:hypothetical protein
MRFSAVSPRLFARRPNAATPVSTLRLPRRRRRPCARPDCPSFCRARSRPAFCRRRHPC